MKWVGWTEINLYCSLLFVLQIEMGGILSEESCPNFAESINFLHSSEDGNLGGIDIYRMTVAPFEYILAFKKSYIENNQNLNRHFAFLQRVKDITHSSIAKVHLCQIVGDKQLCIKYKEINAYCTYYNFTLEQAVAKKIETKGFFMEEEIVYIMSSLLDLALCLEAAGLSFGNYRTGAIYLSPEGRVKVYLMNLEQDNKHNGYYAVLAQSRQINESNLAPEQLAALRSKQYGSSCDYYKADMFAIAMVMLRLMYLGQSKSYYNQDRKEILISKIQFSLEIAQKRYSRQLIGLIKWGLQVLPENRCNFKQASHELAAVKACLGSSVNCIRLDRVDTKEKGPMNSSVTVFNSEIKNRTGSSCNSLTKKTSDQPTTYTPGFSFASRRYRTKSFLPN